MARNQQSQTGSSQKGSIPETAQPGQEQPHQSCQQRLPPSSMPGTHLPYFSGSSNRLFDREPDNRHAEPLLLAQLAAAQLRKLSQHGMLSGPLLQQLAAWLHGIAKVTPNPSLISISLTQQAPVKSDDNDCLSMRRHAGFNSLLVTRTSIMASCACESPL